MNEEAAAAASLKATVAGGGLLSIGGLTANELAILGGLLLGLAGFALQWHYQRQRNQRDRARRAEQAASAAALRAEQHAEHMARMAVLRVTSAAQLAASSSLPPPSPEPADSDLGGL